MINVQGEALVTAQAVTVNAPGGVTLNSNLTLNGKLTGTLKVAGDVRATGTVAQAVPPSQL
jgi:cytoskeletal protein CcmA (bactofilin family)